MNINGFNTIGKPKITGSLISKIAGEIANLAIALSSSFLPHPKIAITKAKVAPEPPIHT